MFKGLWRVKPLQMIPGQNRFGARVISGSMGNPALQL
ncbi:hypothetical protein COLO4_03769 [Corchorus olitorius]|uniref:Uncharacterized protein n=1 Tax=Corchorus olitorius TaxID=93759 RepID=A0A1R3GLD0_9ROSI|nr:hypothetical protein COLO4_34354 [Corchorus olitorius]OMP11536.1 hypothetical protein COLO4_03769 [Corchorus olitorius]